MRKLGTMAATALVALMLVAAPNAMAGSPKGICQAGGVNKVVLADAMAKYWAWYYGGIGTPEIGHLFLVPIPNGEQISDDPLIYQGTGSFTVRAGKTLVLPMSFFVGESYVEGPPDDPANYPIDYKASSLLLKVDGKAVVDSTRTRLDCVYVDVTYFPQPIVYPEPSSYGSNAAIWMFGLGILLPPMSVGQHIIEMQVLSPLRDVWGVDLGYYNTWHVTVVKP
jgi:hypothetical protein